MAPRKRKRTSMHTRNHNIHTRNHNIHTHLSCSVTFPLAASRAFWATTEGTMPSSAARCSVRLISSSMRSIVSAPICVHSAGRGHGHYREVQHRKVRGRGGEGELHLVWHRAWRETGGIPRHTVHRNMYLSTHAYTRTHMHTHAHMHTHTHPYMHTLPRTPQSERCQCNGCNVPCSPPGSP